MRRLGAQTEVAQPGLGQDRDRELDGSLDEQRGKNVRQHMPPGDAQLPDAGGAGGRDELLFPDHQGHRARQAREDRNVENADGEHGVHHRRAKNRCDQDRCQHSGEAEEKVRKTHDGLIDQAAEVSRYQTQADPDGQADGDGDQADDDRVHRARHHPAECVATVLVGAQGMRPGRTL